jgi:hypothetical protein
MSEYDFEPTRGLPGELPPGEEVVWQGAPDWRLLAQQAFHIRLVGAYFGAMLGWRAISGLASGADPVQTLAATASAAPVALLGLGILAFLAWLNSRTTVYTITNRRVVMRFGAAIPKAINIPFNVIEAAALNPLTGGRGDIALTLKAPNKIALLQLWPHARPWRLARPEPTLRCVPEARDAARSLAAAMSAQFPVALSAPETDGRRRNATGALGQPDAVAA